MPGNINVNDDNSDSEKCNEEKEDSEIGRPNYYLIKANNTKWQAKQQIRNIRRGPKIYMHNLFVSNVLLIRLLPTELNSTNTSTDNRNNTQNHDRQASTQHHSQ